MCLLEQVLPALDPKTPVWAAGYTMQLLSRRMQEFGMWDPDRFHVFNMRQRFDLGPFECAPLAHVCMLASVQVAPIQ